MEKVLTAVWITVLIITFIPNTIIGYKYFITKEYKEVLDFGFVKWMCLWTFFCVSAVKLCFVIYSWL